MNIQSIEDVRDVSFKEPNDSKMHSLRCVRKVNDVSMTSSSDVGDVNSFHRAISPVLIVAQCFALLPVDGITAADATGLRFRWCSFRVFYTCFWGCGVLFISIVYIINLLTIATLNKARALVFAGVGLINISIFLRLATKWPALTLKIHDLELAMKLNYGYPKNLSRRLRTVMGIIFFISVVEHLASLNTLFWRSLDCADGSIDAIRIFYTCTFPLIVEAVGYWHVIIGYCQFVNLVATFNWNYMDAFIIMFSMMLTSRIRQVNRRLERAGNTVMPDGFWRQVREDYNALSMLVKLVDDHISAIVLLSFGNNLYFICMQLLNSLQNASTEDTVYFYLSFGHLLLRSTAMCLFAAKIHEESRQSKSTLFSVSSASYSQEVKRLMFQVSNDQIALTGLNFFSVTKTLLLTVAGTIVTYEIVLVQVNSGDSEEISPHSQANWTHHINPLCPNKTTHLYY